MQKNGRYETSVPSIKLFVGPTQATLSNINHAIRIESDRQFEKHDKIQYLKQKVIELQKILEQTSKQNHVLKSSNQLLTKNLKRVNSDVEELFFKREEGIQRTLNKQNRQTETRQAFKNQQLIFDKQLNLNSMVDQQRQRRYQNQKIKQGFYPNSLTANRYLSLNAQHSIVEAKEDQNTQAQNQSYYHRRSKSPQFRNILMDFQHGTENRQKMSRGSCDNACHKRQKTKISHPFKTPNNQFMGAQVISNQSGIYRYDSLSCLSQNNSTSIMNQKRNSKQPNGCNSFLNPKSNCQNTNQNNALQYQKIEQENFRNQGEQFKDFKPVQFSYPKRQVVRKKKDCFRNQKHSNWGFKNGNYFNTESSPRQVDKKTLKKITINQLWQNSGAKLEQNNQRTSRKQRNQLSSRRNGLITPQQSVQLDRRRLQQVSFGSNKWGIKKTLGWQYLEDQDQQLSFSHSKNDCYLQFQKRA